MKQFESKVAVITGGASSFGRSSPGSAPRWA